LEEIPSAGVLYVGDDTTDETVFAVLVNRPGAVTVKVGVGETAAVYRVGAVPDLVDVIQPDFTAPPPGGDRKVSTYHVLLDSQLDVRRRGNAHFRRSAVRIVNDAGAEDYSQISLYADPGYEQLTLHWVRVYRDGILTYRLAATKITVLPVESDLQNRIYSGLESILLVPDLRAGDVLDYAYTLIPSVRTSRAFRDRVVDRLSVPMSGSTYVPPSMIRALRHGARRADCA
jgi:hypothetical protein